MRKGKHEKMKCVDCDTKLKDVHGWAGYCAECFLAKQNSLQDWIKENLLVNRDATGIITGVAGKTAAYIDTEFEKFELLLHLRWFIENYRIVWEKSQIKILYKGEELDFDDVSVGAELVEHDHSKQQNANIAKDDTGMMYQ